MAFIRKLPDVPERLEHLKGGAGHLERYAILSPEEMLGAGTVCARMVLQPGCEVGEHTHHGNYEVYYFLSGHGTYRSNGETTTVDAGPSRVTAKVISCATTATCRWSFWPSCSISPRRHKEKPSPWWGRLFL